MLGRSRLLDLRLFICDVLAHHRVELLRFQFVRMQPLVLGGRVVMPGARRRNQFDFVAHEFPYTLTPLARRSATTTSTPRFSMVRKPRVDTRKLKNRFSI